MNRYKVIGLMSGTSLDGLDMAYCEFRKTGSHWQYEIKTAHTAEYTSEWIDKLKRATQMSGLELVETDLSLGSWMGEQCSEFIRTHQLSPDFIASHGHTVFHQPEKRLTWQIGNGNTLRNESGLPVIADFRSWDVALGGQGAPLVPIGDLLLFEEYPVCLNIGGIANLSAKKDGKIMAYDICGANMVLNYLAQKTGRAYDKAGRIAASGQVDESLMTQLNALAFYQQTPPKSLGYEWVMEHAIPLLENSELPVEDLLCTYTHHAGMMIANEVRKLLDDNHPPPAPPKLLITGGGAYNEYLIDCINKYSENNFLAEIPSELIINYKEALIFAFLGVLRAKKEANVLKEVTGASRNNSGGVIYGFIPE